MKVKVGSHIDKSPKKWNFPHTFSEEVKVTTKNKKYKKIKKIEILSNFIPFKFDKNFLFKFFIKIFKMKKNDSIKFLNDPKINNKFERTK